MGEDVDIYRWIRKMWMINPRTRIKKSKKKYNRKRDKRQFRKRLKEEL